MSPSSNEPRLPVPQDTERTSIPDSDETIGEDELPADPDATLDDTHQSVEAQTLDELCDTSEEADPDATIVPAGEVPDSVKEWEASLDSDVEPGHTIKAPQTTADVSQATAEHTVVLKRRDVLQHGEPGAAPNASASAGADYQIEKLLGEGGMGAVYAARQQSIDRPVAIKVLKSRAARRESSQRAFVSEAVITGGLDHPNIVPIYDVAKQADDALFYAMKQVEGVEWRDRFAENSIAANLDILLRVSDAVAFAHARCIIHRDLKPANIMLGAFGEVLVMDWGLAMPTQDHPRHASFPRAKRGGTPHYMAPEMAGSGVAGVDRRSDVYLLGGILFEIVTGKAPHVLDSPPKTSLEHVKACLAAVTRNVIASTDESGELIEIARTAMATDPANRYQTVPEFQAAIREYLTHEESIERAARAADRLDDARQSKAYDDFSRARFGFETALEQWPGNVRAAEGLDETRRDYARAAFDRGDFDLALTLLDAADPDHVALVTSIQDSATERDSRMDRIRRLRRFGLAATLTIGVLALLTGATGALGLHRVANSLKDSIDHGLKIERLANQVEVSLLQARRREKDFLLRWRSEGVEQARSSYVTANAVSIAELFKLTSELDKEIQEHPPSEAGHFEQKLADLRGMIEVYRDEFGQLVELIQTMGVKDTGGVGQFRTAVHKLEARIQSSQDLVASQTTLLQLRRHEKDYLIRGDDAYIEHARETAAQLRREIEKALPEDESQSAMLEMLDAYLTNLYNVVRISRDIDERTSLFRDAAHRIESSSHKFAATGVAEGHRQIAEAEAICANAYATVTAFVAMVLVLGLGFAYVLGRNLTIPMRLLSATAVQVADCDLSR